MPYSSQLSFFRQLLKDMNISSCILDCPYQSIPSEVDLQLRSSLFNLSDYAGFLQNSIAQAKEKTLYRFFDEYNCNYLFLKLPDGERFFFVGPYLTALPPQEWIAGKAFSLGLSAEAQGWLKLYYSSLPLLENENLLMGMANTFAKHLWGGPDAYAMEYVDYAIHDRYEPIPHSPLPGQSTESSLDLSAMERNYANENLLMDAVSKGKLHLVTSAATAVSSNVAERRLPDTLRDRKNYLIILKTLLRKAAEYGGVHPWHIHRLSSYYARQIENARTVKQAMLLQEEMIRSFCLLVKRHSLSKYTSYVGQAITLVQYDLTADLSLKNIAERLNVNSSYLSRLFHQETGCTLTEFVGRQRVEHAMHLLQLSSRTVQDVAAECGIHDVSYFIKLFKKHTGLTPLQFREKEQG